MLAIASGFAGCGGKSETESSEKTQAAAEKTFQRVRGPVVAGAVKPKDEGVLYAQPLFYPRHAESLSAMVDGFLAEADPEPVENLRALICPHAGYDYSGPVAASGYKLLKGQEFETVIVLAPSHTAAFEGASLPNADAYETPLGLIPISSKAAALAETEPFAVEPPSEVHRPAFWKLSLGGAPRPSGFPPELPKFGEDTPHSWEHSLEVQLPFLQKTLGEFELVPVVFGQNLDYAAAARELTKQFDETTLLVASSDLSHNLPYHLARGKDTTCCRAICDLDVGWMEHQDACGRGPILALLHVARAKGWRAKLLDYRNSGDTTGDQQGRIVGYAAIAFYEPHDAAPPMPQLADPKPFAAEQRKQLLQLARSTVENAVKEKKLPDFNTEGVAAEFLEPHGCFVTLKRDGLLRGCIGSIFPQMPLHQAVQHAAFSAALTDRRFPPVGRDELKLIEFEVSVLSMPRPLEFDSPEDLLAKLRPGVDGVVLRLGQHGSTYLPQVWEQLPNKREFLGKLAEKAGLKATDWQDPEVEILIYQVEAFSAESIGESEI